MAPKNRSYAKRRGYNSEGDTQIYCPAQGEDDPAPAKKRFSTQCPDERAPATHTKVDYLVDLSASAGREGGAE